MSNGVTVTPQNVTHSTVTVSNPPACGGHMDLFDWWTVVFAALKVTGLADVSWYFVLAPLVVGLTLGFIKGFARGWAAKS